MFPKAANNRVNRILQDAAHDMDEILEVKGHAALPGLDMVREHLCSKQGDCFLPFPSAALNHVIPLDPLPRMTTALSAVMTTAAAFMLHKSC